MVSLRFAERVLRRAFGTKRPEIGGDAVRALRDFLERLAEAVSKRTAALHLQDQAGRVVRRDRLYWGPVRRALREVLARPELYLADDFEAPRPAERANVAPSHPCLACGRGPSTYRADATEGQPA